jgi:hypothetical protein
LDSADLGGRPDLDSGAEGNPVAPTLLSSGLLEAGYLSDDAL